MRVRECSWPPSLVVEWLCRQLEQRGIPGTLYAHTVLSLLHSHYCLHSAAAHYTTASPSAAAEQGLVVGTPPTEALLEHCASLLQDYHTHQCESCRPTHSNNIHGAAASEHPTPATVKQHDRSSRRLLGGAGLLKGALLLEEEEDLILGQNLHPDADLPLVPRNPKTPNKTKPEQKQACCCESSSRRARKRHRKLLQQELSLECFSPERLQKLTALQCLLSASDLERSDLEALLEELCRRLKASASHTDGGADGSPPPSPPPPPPPATHNTDKVAILKKGSKAACVNEPSQQTAACDAQRYFAAFPALPRDSESGGPSSSSLTASPVIDCAWGCKEICGHGDNDHVHCEDTPTRGKDTPACEEDTPACEEDTPACEEDTPTREEDTPTREEVTPTRGEVTLTREDDTPTRKDATPTDITGEEKTLKTNNRLTACLENATTTCTENPSLNNIDVTSDSLETCVYNHSPRQNASSLIVDQNSQNLSLNDGHDIDSEGSEEVQNSETVKITNSLDNLVNAVNTSTSPQQSASEERFVDQSSIDIPNAGENLESISSSSSVASVETPLATRLIEISADDASNNLAIVSWKEPLVTDQVSEVPLINELAVRHTSASIDSDLELDFLVTTSGAPFRTRSSDTFVDPLTPCKLYSVSPNSTDRKSVSPLLNLKSLTNFAANFDGNSGLDFSVLQNLDAQETPSKSQSSYSIWDSTISPLVKLAFRTQSGQFNWKNTVPASPELTNISELENLIPDNAENAKDGNILSEHNANTVQNIYISPSDLKSKRTLPFITKRISPSDLKCKRKLPYGTNETLGYNENLMTFRFQDRIESEQVESKLTAGHGMERSDQMSSLVSAQRGVMPQPQYQSYAGHQISFGDIEPPTDLEPHSSSHHYTGGDSSYNAPDDLKLLSMLEAQKDQRSAAETKIVTSAGGGFCLGNTTVNMQEREIIPPNSTTSLHPSMMFHQPHPAHPMTSEGPLARPAHAGIDATANSNGVNFSQGYSGAYVGQQCGVDGPLEAGYVGDISSRESSEDRQDYDEALADDEDDEEDRRHGVARRHQPEEDKRRRLSEKKRIRMSSQSGSHKQDNQLNAFTTYRGGVPLPPPPPSSMLSSQEQMQLELKFIEDHERKLFERNQQELQQQQQLEHLKQMNFLQEQLLFMQQQQQQQQQEPQRIFTSAADPGNLVGPNSQIGNPHYRMAGDEPNLWDQNLSGLDSNVKHTLAQYFDLLNQPNSKTSLQAPSVPFSPSTENNRLSSSGIPDYLLRSLMESPAVFDHQKAEGGGDPSVCRSISNDHQDSWVDQNANSLSSSTVSAPMAGLANFHPQQVELNSSAIGVGYDNNDDEEKSLCKTFQSLGLERIWDSDAVTSVSDEYGLARQQMLQAGSLYQLSDQFMQQQQQLQPPQQSHSQQQLPQRVNSGARVWPTALQSHAQMQRSDPGPATSSIVNPTFLRLSSGPSEQEKDLSCYALNNLPSFSSAICSDTPPQQPLQKQAVNHDQVLAPSLSDGMELRGASAALAVSGPSGVQAVLQHSTQSNFSSVVPRKANMQGQDYIKPTTFADVPTSVEENLLTSPRTHFRPIKLHDETSVNSTLTNYTATSTHVPLSLPYQRSNSGTLFLEKDSIDGSPKKYMIYKDPADKTIQHRPLYMPNQESSLVPKFKVVKNEKFCQTDGTNHDFGPESSAVAASSMRRTPSPESDDDYDVFAFQKNDLARRVALQRKDQPTHDVHQRNEPPFHASFQSIDQASNTVSHNSDRTLRGAFHKVDQVPHEVLQRYDQMHHNVVQRNDQLTHDSFRNNLASNDPLQKMQQTSRDAFHINDRPPNNSTIRDCWADNTIKEDGWKTFNLNNNLINNGSNWAPGANDADQQLHRMRTSLANGRGDDASRGLQTNEELQQRWNECLKGSPSRSFCRNLLGPILDGNTPTSVGQFASGHNGRKDRVIDTPAARAIWSSNPTTSVSGQQSHQAVIAAQHIDPAIKALWANSPDDKLKLAAAAAAYYNANNSRGNEEQSALPAWTMKRRVSGGIEQQIPTEWLAEQSILYTLDEQKDEEKHKDDAGSCGITFPDHLANYYPQDETWSSGDDCGPSNTDDYVRGIWSKAKQDSWNSNEETWQKKALRKLESGENWNDEACQNLKQKSEIWMKEGSENWGKQDGRWKGGNINNWSEGDNGCHPQGRGDQLKGLREYSEASSKQIGSIGGGMWPVLSSKDHLDDLALLAEAQNWEKAVNLSASECAEAGNSQHHSQSNRADHLQEDLEELDPSWQLQEGFVWDPHTGNTPRKIPPQQQQSGNETDDFDDTASQSSDGSCSSSEVVMVQTEDGGTLAVQVEYLDEELYDKIFGAPDLQMAGSLPDLPNNQAGLKVLRERWLPPWRRPCTFFMEGSCRRKHCKFSHDLSSITCRFWQDGSCLKGSECPFLHGYPVLPRRRNRSEGDSRGGAAATDGQQGSVLSQQLRRDGGKQRHRLSSFELSSETDFPSLGAAPDTKESERGGASGAAAGSGGANTSGASQQSAQSTPQQQQQIRKKTKYTPITAAILQASSGNPGSSSNKGRRRRHTHSAQRSHTPEGHKTSSGLSTSAMASAVQRSSHPDNGSHTDKGTLIIKPGTTITTTASSKDKTTTSGAGNVVPAKGRTRRNQNKIKETARAVMAGGASAPSTAEGGGGRVHGDGTVSDY